MSSMSVSGSIPEAALLDPIQQQPAKAIPLRIQARQMLKETARSTFSSAKSLGKVAAIFSGIECAIESVCPF